MSLRRQKFLFNFDFREVQSCLVQHHFLYFSSNQQADSDK